MQLIALKLRGLHFGCFRQVEFGYLVGRFGRSVYVSQSRVLDSFKPVSGHLPCPRSFKRHTDLCEGKIGR